MSILSKNRITSIIILIIASFLLYANEQIKAPNYDLLGSKFFPRVVCVLIIVFGIALFFMKDEKIKHEKIRIDYSYFSVIFFMILSLFYLAALENNIGFLRSSIVYVFILNLMLNKYQFKDFFKAVFFSVISCYAIYTFFQNILRLQLP